ncbi:MAG: glutamine--tRNA ligase/YqeY domain fusion protein [Eubacteriales bacterium]
MRNKGVNKVSEELRDSIPQNFIHDFIDQDIAIGGDFQGMTVHTRFPPEPNGYLHIGHCKALLINFGTAQKYGGICNLRMDDTNPAKEDEEFVRAIQEDVRWLGFDWADNFFYGSDYFQKNYEIAVSLIEKGLAYVCQLSPEEFKERRGDITTPGTSPYRDRPVEESLALFAQMKEGKHQEGSHTLRAKIDLESGNFNLRDPIIYRIRFQHHHRQGDNWCIYPMYDFAHPIQDALEGVTHSLCSLEFESHRPLYDWVVEHAGLPAKPRQIEFARLGLSYTVMSKRKLRQLVETGAVSGWDDPRMPTLSGLRRRGYTSQAIHNFSNRNGVAKVNSTVEYAFLEHCLREDLNENARRVMAVIDPLKLTITNYPEGQSETFEIENNPNQEEAGTRTVTFSRSLYIERDDFLPEKAPKYKRMYPGNEVRLKGAFLATCTSFTQDADGNITEVFAEYDPLSHGGKPADGRKVKGAVIHWVDSETAVDATVNLYSNLFSHPDPESAGDDFVSHLNPDSLKVLENCKLEASLAEAKAGESFQFLRLGYFCVDTDESKGLCFNRSVSLKDSK